MRMYRLRTRSAGRLLAALACCLACYTAGAQESMMQDISYPYLEKLIAAARENYPKVKTYDTRIGIAHAGLNKARMSYFDILSFSYLYNPQNGGVVNPNINTNNLFGYQLGVFVNIGGILQKPAIVKQARGEEKLAKEEMETYQLSIEAEVQQRYFLYVQELTILKLRSQTMLDAEGMLKDTRYRYEKGEATLDEYSKVLILYAEHQTAAIQAEGSMLVARSRLEEILGTKLETIR